MPRREHRRPPWLLLVALLAVSVTVAVAVIVEAETAQREAQDPNGIPPSWRDALATAPVISTREAADALPADTTAVRLATPGPAVIASLARLRQLRAVALTGAGHTPLLTLTPEISEALLRHTRVQALELKVVSSEAEGLAPLERLPLLRELRIRTSPSPTLLSILPTRGLQRLAIDLGGAEPRGWREFLARSSGLRALEIDGSRAIDAAHAAALRALPDLQELALRRHRGIDEELIAAIVALPRLSALDLEGGVLANPGALSPLRDNPRIRRLSLARAINMTRADLDDVVTMPNLTDLDIESFSRTRQLAPPAKLFDFMNQDPLPALRHAHSLRRVNLGDVYSLKLDDLQAVAEGWDYLDLRDARLLPPSDAPDGAGPLEITDAEALRKILGVKVLIR